ncbi:hypothetical protein [Oligoflexus tunisiensis]|uniref:hypothetical protein n=1 Tax=Oligoflexus tunisiensis TaxID=708132 RepID=UPI00114CD59B|nr:hypothetical protein [Oligoflexus tunisiensis]
MKKPRILILLLAPLLLSSCLYQPLSRKFTQWSSDICGRKTFFERLCTGVVVLLMFPVHLGAILIDIPLSMLEFFFGFAPFKDPLVKTSSIDFKEHRFPGVKDGEEWLVQRLVEMPDRFHVRRLVHKQLIEEYVMMPMEGGQLKVYAGADSTVSRLIPREYRVAALPESNVPAPGPAAR